MAAATQEPQRDPVLEDRLEQFTDLGYTVPEAEELAQARDRDGNFARVDAVQDMLDRGATHAQVVRILRPLPKTYDPSIPDPPKDYAGVV